MTRDVAALEEEIRSLDSADKERLLSMLIEELDGPYDPGAEGAWLEEIQRRSAEIDAGVAQMIPAAVVHARPLAIPGDEG